MHGRRGILVAVLALCACNAKDAAPAPSESAQQPKQPTAAKAEAEAAVAEAKAAIVEAKTAIDEAKAGTVEPPYPSLDPKLLEAIVAMLESAPPDPDVRIRMAAAALEDLEANRLPKDLIDALDAIGTVSPDQVALVIAKAISGGKGEGEVLGGLVRSPGERAWLDVCEEGNRVFSALATVAPEDRARLLWEACKFEKNGLLDRDEALSAKNTMLPMFAITIHGYIKARTEVHPVERQVLRTFATGK